MEEIKYPTKNHNINWLLEQPNRALESSDLSDVVRILIIEHNKLVREVAKLTNEKQKKCTLTDVSIQ